jgi:hypothetical protein
LPREDWQVSVKVESALRVWVRNDPLVGRLPDQAPLAVHWVTLADAQLSSTVLPSVMRLTSLLNVSAGLLHQVLLARASGV